MLTHHLASSPRLRRARSSSPCLKDSDREERNRTKVELEGFEGPGTDNERDALTSSITEGTGLDSGSIKKQGIIFWAKKVAFSDESTEPTTPQRPKKSPKTMAVTPLASNQPHIRLHLPQAVSAHLSPFPPHPQDPTDLSINQVMQEIQTLERIANRLNDLYSLRDSLIRRGSQRRSHRR